MTPHQLRSALDAALADRQLLAHPFYRRWEAGTLSRDELGVYAAQYRHFETALPEMLEHLLAKAEGRVAEIVAMNLHDERSRPAPHAELFETFAAAVEAGEAGPSPAMRTLLDTYRDAVGAGVAQGLAAVVAYEMQAPGIAASKGRGLRANYGLDATGTEFWDVHAVMDRDHADWAIDALAGIPGTDTAVAAARAAADAWGHFLDEREAVAASA